VLSTPAGQTKVISPITTLVQAQLRKDPSLSLTQATAKVKQLLGEDESINLFEDFVSTNNDNLHKKAQVINNVFAQALKDIREKTTNDSDFNEDSTLAIALSVLEDKLPEISAKVNTAIAQAKASNSSVIDISIDEIISDLKLDFGFIDSAYLKIELEKIKENTPPQTNVNNRSMTTQSRGFVTSTQCPNGGIEVSVGIDENGNGTLDSDEVDLIQQVCNGSNGNNSLIKTTFEPVGENCLLSNGMKISVGPDLNANNTLDDNEIIDNSYTCNGINAVDGTNGIDGTSGANGVDGTNGIDGASGANGVDGINGINGTSGANGLNTLISLKTSIIPALCNGLQNTIIA